MPPREPSVRQCCGGAPALALLREAGSLFVARMLTVVTTLRSQNRNVLEYMTKAIRAARCDQSAPSLLPETAVEQENLKMAA